MRPHDVNAYYLGWAGDGHIGRLNVTHAFYEAFGHDDFNGLAGRPVDINAQMAALEVSYDRDWMRYKASFFYASGDDNATDGTAHGFDTIVDNPNFTGGPFSFWARQGFNLGGTMVNLKQRNSLVPDLRTSKTEGQANFVNPGVFHLRRRRGNRPDAEAAVVSQRELHPVHRDRSAQDRAAHGQGGATNSAGT